MNRAAKARLQLRAVSVLRTLKRDRTYEELAAETGLPANDLNRYVNGHVLPGEERARDIVETVGERTLARELDDRLRRDREGYVDNTAAVFDQPFLDLVAPVAASAIDCDDPDAVLTAATDGITFGAAMAAHYGCDLAYAKKSKETAVQRFVEARKRLESGIEITYYLPATALNTGDRVVVVDDLIRSGETQELLLDLAESAGARVAGVYTLVAAGEKGISRARERVDAPVECLTRID